MLTERKTCSLNVMAEQTRQVRKKFQKLKKSKE